MRWPYTYIYVRKIFLNGSISRIVETLFQMCVHGCASCLRAHAEGNRCEQSGPELIQCGPLKIGLLKNIPVIEVNGLYTHRTTVYRMGALMVKTILRATAMLQH